MDYTDILRRHLATLAFRVRHAVKEAPMGFEDFDAGMGARTPGQILNHINAMMAYCNAHCMGQKPDAPEELSWLEAIEEFHSLLRHLDAAITSDAKPDDDTILRLYQGPLSDAMTHVGQLMMLRRLAGSPVQGVNYYRAEIENGHLGPDQKVPV